MLRTRSLMRLGTVAGVATVIWLGGVAHADDEATHRTLVRQGARLWSPYCGNCHNARPSGERSPAEWDTLMMHMRVRANIPGDDARALVEYLKSR